MKTALTSKKNDLKKENRSGVLLGGTGLVGGAISEYFIRNTPETIEVFAPNSKKLSIRNAIDIKKYIRRKKPDFVINAAMAALNSGAQLTLETNYLGAINLARVCCALQIPYIHISSAATLPDGENLSEDDCLPLYPNLGNYAKSKVMTEKTLRVMKEKYGLDYTIIRLAIVYGKHDHKIQGFHRLFFSIADEAMPFVITKKGAYHSYSNARKLPYFVHHVLDHREEFSGEIYHFVDREPVELATLICTIRSYLELKRPYNVYPPQNLVKVGKYLLEKLAGMLDWVGISIDLPSELVFLENFYKTQTLSNKKLQNSSFPDPFPEETIFSLLPDMVIYYLTRWGHLNLISTFNEEYFGYNELEIDFQSFPRHLLDSMHSDSIAPYYDVLQENKLFELRDQGKYDNYVRKS